MTKKSSVMKSSLFKGMVEISSFFPRLMEKEKESQECTHTHAQGHRDIHTHMHSDIVPESEVGNVQ